MGENSLRSLANKDFPFLIVRIHVERTPVDDACIDPLGSLGSLLHAQLFIESANDGPLELRLRHRRRRAYSLLMADEE
jgi:hypothetical protein